MTAIDVGRADSARPAGGAATFKGVDPSTNQLLDPFFNESGPEDLERACSNAWQAFDVFRATALETRASFLEEIAEGILALGDKLIIRAMAETGLPRGRLEGERRPITLH